MENRQPLCRSCNSAKGVKTVDYKTRLHADWVQLTLDYRALLSAADLF